MGGKQREDLDVYPEGQARTGYPVAESSEKNREESRGELCALAKWFQITCPVTGHLVVSALKPVQKDGKVTRPDTGTQTNKLVSSICS